MLTSGTNLFLPDIADVIEEAYERCGIESRTGYDVRTARRSLDIMALEWANRGVNLWAVDSATIPLVAGTAMYSLPADTVDLLDVVIRTGVGTAQTDIAVQRLSLGDYSSIPAKNVTGRPVNYYVDRGAKVGGVVTAAVVPTVTVWPVPDVGTYSLTYWRMRRIQDSGTSGALTMDTPARFVPSLIAGLAYYLAMKKSPERMGVLKAIYDEQFQMASEEDRERTSFYCTPRGR